MSNTIATLTSTDLVTIARAEVLEYQPANVLTEARQTQRRLKNIARVTYWASQTAIQLRDGGDYIVSTSYKLAHAYNKALSYGATEIVLENAVRAGLQAATIAIEAPNAAIAS